MAKLRLFFVGNGLLAICAMIAGGAGALFLLPSNHQTGNAISPIETGSIRGPALINSPHNNDAQLLRNALVAFENGDTDVANIARNGLPEGSNLRAALDWALAVEHPDRLSVAQLSAAKDRFANWPGRDAIASNLEIAQLSGAGGLVQRVLGSLPDEPVTTTGKLALADRLIARGETEQAHAIVAPLWHSSTLWRSLEAEFPDRFGDVLTVDDHRIRYFNMMVRERISAGGRVVDLAEMPALHEAWAAVIRNRSNAKALVADLPDDQLETPHGVYMRVELARKSGLDDEAAALLLQLLDNEDARINADAWWNEIRIVSRNLREAGDHDTAYQLADSHIGGSPTTAVDAAFHAGWYALRGLEDAEKALPHFKAILDVATGSASTSRAHYWIGRTLSAKGDEAAAQAAYEQAAAFPTTYHGQLALSELGRPLRVGQPVHDAVDMAAGLRNEIVRAGLLLAEAGQDKLALRLMTGLGETLEDPGVLSALVARLNEDGKHFMALRLAKRAQWHGREIGIATHPVGALPLSDDTDRVDLALAYAIARQESEFRLDAVSSADARGLLQLLPSTASEVARSLGLPFNAARLTTDAAYNTRLGTQYLAEQLDRFDASYVLTFIAYNAGPGRAREWIERFGDPGGLPLHDVVDWVEQIPFPETRGYVQKVMENLQVYKARLKANPDIGRDLRSGRG